MKIPESILIPVVVDLEHHPDCPENPRNQGKSGPSTVATDEYRSGWDNVFGNKQPVGQA